MSLLRRNKFSSIEPLQSSNSKKKTIPRPVRWACRQVGLVTCSQEDVGQVPDTRVKQYPPKWSTRKQSYEHRSVASACCHHEHEADSTGRGAGRRPASFLRHVLSSPPALSTSQGSSRSSPAQCLFYCQYTTTDCSFRRACVEIR